MALEQGVGAVVSGSIAKLGNDYMVAVKATRPVTGEELVNAQATASSKDTVLQAATQLMAEVRNALGDDESESSQQFKMASLSVTSLDVVRPYAAAMAAASANKFEDALQNALKTIEIDKNFGLGYLIATDNHANLEIDRRAQVSNT